MGYDLILHQRRPNLTHHDDCQGAVSCKGAYSASWGTGVLLHPRKGVWRPLFLFLEKVKEAMRNVHLASSKCDCPALVKRDNFVIDCVSLK